MASLKKRGNTYWAQYYVNGKQKRVNLETESLQIAKEKIRNIETAFFRGDDLPLPTKTPLSEILEKYLSNLRARTKEKNVVKVVSYLRGTFGEACESLKIKNHAIAKKAIKRPSSGSNPRIEISYLEQLTTQQVSEFLSNIVRSKGISPRTVNHYRQNLVTLCNWAMREGGVKFPGGKNPGDSVGSYKVPKLAITFLRLHDISEQLDSLADSPALQAMVALYVYAGLRREEAVWLTPDDIEWDWGQNGAIWVRAKTVGAEYWETKTKEDRIVPISRQLRAYLDRYRPVAGSTWFFPSPKGRRWDPDNFSESLRDANARNKLTWSCLDFRHTFGSQLAMKGESLMKISKLMGNSPEVCRKHYLVLMPESLMESVDFMEAEVIKRPDRPVTKDISPTDSRPRLRLIVNNR